MTKNASNQAAPKRRWWRFGPGLLLACAAIAWLWPHLFPAAKPPHIERSVQSSTVPAALSSAPETTWLLQQRDVLKLNAAQAEKLQKLVARWQRDTKSLRVALESASANYNRDMAHDAKAGRKVTIEQLQERAGPVSELSRQLSQARRAWWDEAAQVLADEQRRNAEQMWTRRFLKAP